MTSLKDKAGVRAFAVSNKQDIAYAVSEDTYREKFMCLTEAMAPYFLRDRPNLVVFTEDAGLITAFTGSRGAVARTKTTIFDAMFSLIKAYQPQFNYYTGKYGSSLLGRALLLALTDVIWRPFYNTFSFLAKKYGVYALACTNVADIVESTAPQDISFFGDPDHPERTSVFLPEGDGVWNTCFLFGPDGSIVRRTKKVNLVQEEKDLLQLTPGAITDVTSYTIPGTDITVCTGISLDAFIPGFLTRLTGQGCTVLMQPDANNGVWTSDRPYWQPEDWLGSTLGSLQAQYSILYDINSMMTGNLFDMVFDGQSAITGKTDPRAIRSANYVGCDPLQDPFTGAPMSFTTGVSGFTTYTLGGFILMGPWVIPDPGLSDPSLTREQRRSILNEKGIALAPSGAEEDHYLETILIADLF